MCALAKAPALMLMRTLVFVVAVVMVPRGLWAGAGPVSVSDDEQWVADVLEREAPRMSADDRKVVARTVAEESRANRLDPVLVLAVMQVESSYRTRVVSNMGARGLMQIMPHVALSLTSGAVGARQLFDPETNVRLGTVLLRNLVRRHRGDLPEALAAYNMGSTKVRKLMRQRHNLRGKDFIYSRKVMAQVARLRTSYPRAPLATN